ncbi:MAG TPA: hypothetical protein VKB63_08305 [Gemmatimonadales bacterium]|nr:hypothetical protein [Gemmatimonadales bacterium]
MIRRIQETAAIAGLVLAGAVVTPGAARAQAKFELTPFFASYYALLTMSNDANGDGSNVKIQQTASSTWGGRLTYWVSPTIGIEAAGGYSKSGLRAFANDTSTSGGLSFSVGGNIVTASARMLYRPARTNLHFIIGGGIVHRGGTFWKNEHDQDTTKLTSPAAILGAGVRASVTPKFALNVSLEANLYSFDPDGTATAMKSKLNADVLLSIGVPITLSK